MRGGMIAAAAMAANRPLRLLAQDSKTLDVASAGSIRAMLDGPIKTATAQSLKLDLHSHAGGADAMAKSLLDGELRADVFIPVTASPMRTVMAAGGCAMAQPIARTELVLVYSPKSRFLARFEAATAGEANWWEVLQEPGLRLVRSNPAGDPSGRAILFAMMLAAKKYKQPNLVQKVLGETLNAEQILTGGNVQARLLSGEIDVMGTYKIGPAGNKQAYLTLPSDVNLSRLNVHAENPELSLSIAGKSFYPEPLVFYAGRLKDAANASGAAAFLAWLQGEEAEALFRSAQFDPVGDAVALYA
jgi:molybdate/tungstate transport system substrate-binding protein